MKNIKKLLCSLIISLTILLTGCVMPGEYIDITNGDTLIVEVGETVQLDVNKTSGVVGSDIWLSSGSCVSVDENGHITAIMIGTATITVSNGSYSDQIIIQVVEDEVLNVTISLFADKMNANVGSTITLDVVVNPSDRKSEVVYNIVSGSEYASLNGNILSAKAVGSVVVNAKIGSYASNNLTIQISEVTTDPYQGMSKSEFYKNYEEADSYTDAQYRSKHGFMSGSIEEQDQEPTISNKQPRSNGLLLKNSKGSYSSDGNTYFVVDEQGNIVNTIYRGGGYVTLEEVAAYVYAFGDIPANYSSKKSGKPTSSPWGEYLRLNHSRFSGNTRNYPYEPELPNINGCGGDLEYYEIDLGTTGTDCDPKYKPKLYNNGTEITRGAARIVYSRFDERGNKIQDVEDKYVFYTYNHYNDFQEYLNYENGWGEMFGNITGGGKISSKSDYNPTPYVKVVLADFTTLTLDFSTNSEKTVWPEIIVNYKKEEEGYSEI